jgi:hypothetical protein
MPKPGAAMAGNPAPTKMESKTAKKSLLSDFN